MKLIKHFQRFKSESILISYFVILLFFIGCAYQQKKIQRENRIQAQAPKPTFVNKQQIQDSFYKCDLKYFLQFKPEDFLHLKTRDILYKSWDRFFDSVVDPGKGSSESDCYKMIDLLAANGVRASFAYVVHDLLSRNKITELNRFIESKIISVLVLQGAYDQFAILLKRFPDEKSFKIFDYEIDSLDAKNYLNTFEKFKIKNNITNLNHSVPGLEVFYPGKNYSVCGLHSSVKVYKEKNIQSTTEQSFRECADSVLEAEITVVSIDADWIEFKYNSSSSRPTVGNVDIDDVETVMAIREQEKMEGNFFIERRFITTPYIVTDGEIQIAITETGPKSIELGIDEMVVEDGNYSCDNKDLIPELEITTKKSVPGAGNDNRPEVYKYPAGFKREQATIIKNFEGSFPGAEECGT